MSTNLCTDQLALLLADPAQIAALSPLARDCRISALCAQAMRFADPPAQAETVLALRPGLLLAGRFGAPAASRIARLGGLRVLTLDPATDRSSISAQLRRVGAALGHAERGAALAEAFDAGWAALRTQAAGLAGRPRAAWLGPRATLSEPGSLEDALLGAAGFVPMHGTPDLERLLLDPPDLLVVQAPSGGRSLAQAVLDHPSLSAAFADRRVAIPGTWTICGAPRALDALALLVAAHRRLTSVAHHG